MGENMSCIPTNFTPKQNSHMKKLTNKDILAQEIQLRLHPTWKERWKKSMAFTSLTTPSTKSCLATVWWKKI